MLNYQSSMEFIHLTSIGLHRQQMGKTYKRRLARRVLQNKSFEGGGGGEPPFWGQSPQTPMLQNLVFETLVNSYGFASLFCSVVQTLLGGVEQ